MWDKNGREKNSLDLPPGSQCTPTSMGNKSLKTAAEWTRKHSVQESPMTPTLLG